MVGNIKVSVVIGTYNHGRYIADCIQSVLNQTYKQFEIIVIDDGSTDNTADVVRPFLDKITYIHQKNSGRAASRNAGIRQARYDWVAFLDADDLWDENKLEKQVAAVTAHPEIDLLVTNACWFNESGIVKADYFKTMNLMPLQKQKREGSLIKFEERLFPLFIDENFVNLSSVLVKKDCLIKEGLFDEALPRAQDRDLWLRMSRHCRFAALDEILTRSRQHTLSDGPKTIVPYLSRVTLFEKAYHSEGEFENRYRRELASRVGRCHFDLGHFYFFRENDFPKARQEFRLSYDYGYRPAILPLYITATYFPRGIIIGLRRFKNLFRW